MVRYIATKNLTGFDTEASMIADGAWACRRVAQKISEMYQQPVSVDFEAWWHNPGESLTYRFFSSPHGVDAVAFYNTKSFYEFVGLLSWLLKGGSQDV